MRILVTGGAGYTPHNSLLPNGLRSIMAVASYAGRAKIKPIISKDWRVE